MAKEGSKTKRGERAEKSSKSINMALFARYYTGNIAETQRNLEQDGFEISTITLRRYAAEPEFSEMVRDENKNKAGIASASKVKALLSEWLVGAENPFVRLQSAEMLLKCHGEFVNKLEVDEKISLTSALDRLLDKQEKPTGPADGGDMKLSDLPSLNESQPSTPTEPAKPKRKAKAKQ